MLVGSKTFTLFTLTLRVIGFNVIVSLELRWVIHLEITRKTSSMLLFNNYIDLLYQILYLSFLALWIVQYNCLCLFVILMLLLIYFKVFYLLLHITLSPCHSCYLFSLEHDLQLYFIFLDFHLHLLHTISILLLYTSNILMEDFPFLGFLLLVGLVWSSGECVLT